MIIAGHVPAPWVLDASADANARARTGIARRRYPIVQDPATPDVVTVSGRRPLFLQVLLSSDGEDPIVSLEAPAERSRRPAAATPAVNR